MLAEKKNKNINRQKNREISALLRFNLWDLKVALLVRHISPKRPTSGLETLRSQLIAQANPF